MKVDHDLQLEKLRKEKDQDGSSHVVEIDKKEGQIQELNEEIDKLKVELELVQDELSTKVNVIFFFIHSFFLQYFLMGNNNMWYVIDKFFDIKAYLERTVYLILKTPVFHFSFFLFFIFFFLFYFILFYFFSILV